MSNFGPALYMIDQCQPQATFLILPLCLYDHRSKFGQLLLRLLFSFQNRLRDKRLDIPIISYRNYNFFYQCFNFRQKKIQIQQMRNYIVDIFMQSFELFFDCQML